MAVYLSPVGLSTAQVPSFLLTIQKDKLYVVIQRYKAELSCIHS